MMGGQCSKNKNGSDSPQPQPQPPRRSQSQPHLNSPSRSPPLPFEMSRNSMFSSHLKSYEDACRFDPSVRAFDEVIQQRTLRALGTLRTGVDGWSLSLGSLSEVTEYLQDMELESARVILANKEGVWKSKDMSALVEQYFENSMQTLEFCTSLEKCLKRAATSQLVVRAAVSHYEEELIGLGPEPSSGPKSFERMVRALESFKAAGDPFTEEFFGMLGEVLEKQTAMLKRLSEKKTEIDKKLKYVETYRRLSNVIFVAVFVSVLVCSIVVAALAAPPVVVAIVSAVAVSLGSVGKWCSSLWNRYAKALKGKREMIDSVTPGLRVTLKDLQNIRVLVDKLEDKIQYLTENVEFALIEEGSVKVVMEEIKKSLEEFAETTEKLSRQNIKCIQDVTMARAVVVRKIISQSSSD